MRTRPAGLVVAVTLWATSPAAAQPLGTFRWQLQPFCNVVTVAITQNGPIYRLEGTDDQCGNGADAASVTGTAFPNADGTIGFGLNIVTAPGGRPVHVDAEINLGTFSGTWRDSTGGAGTFALTPGSGNGGAARPLPPPGIPPAIDFRTDGGFVARGSVGQGAIPASGLGIRAMWFAGKAAFRAGQANGVEWDDANVGQYSVAFGLGTRADGFASMAAGSLTQASGSNSTALGSSTKAIGQASTALGLNSFANGGASTAIGQGTRANGVNALAGGLASVADGTTATAIGDTVRATGNGSVALGTHAVAIGNGSFVFADRSVFTDYAASGPNQFFVRAAGGVEFASNAAATLGVRLASNGTQWLSLSDARTKHDFRDLDADEVLGRLAAMPVTEWSYDAQDAGIRHIGPTAQDFHAAFGLGEDPLRIGTLDASGVALAGVKALEARTHGLPDRLAALEAENAALRAALAEARRRVGALTDDNTAINDRVTRLERLLGKQ